MPASVFVHAPNSPLAVYDNLAALKDVPAEATVWVDVETESEEDLKLLAGHFGLHELAIEDCLTPGHFPKLEDYGHCVFIVLRALKPWAVVEDIWKAMASQLEETDDTIRRLAEKIRENEEEGRLTRKISIFLSRKFIITHRRREISWLDAVVRQISESSQRYLERGTDALAHHVIDVLTDRFLRGINFFEGVIEKAEDESVANPLHFDMGRILELKRALIWLRQIVRDQLQVVARLSMDSSLPVQDNQRRYFKDIVDNVQSIAHVIDKQIDSLTGVRDAYFAATNTRLNDTMRILAIITTIAAPLNVIVGLYGMNFHNMPFLNHAYGFWGTIVFMVVISIAMLLFFRKKQWL